MTLRPFGLDPNLGLIRIGGHLSYGGYDVQTDGRHTEAPRAAAVHGRVQSRRRALVVHVVWPTLVDGPQQGIRLFRAATADGKTFTAPQMAHTLGTPKPAHLQMVLDRCGDLALVSDELQDKSGRIALRTLTTAGKESSTVQTTILNNDSSGVY